MDIDDERMKTGAAPAGLPVPGGVPPLREGVADAGNPLGATLRGSGSASVHGGRTYYDRVPAITPDDEGVEARGGISPLEVQRGAAEAALAMKLAREVRVDEALEHLAPCLERDAAEQDFLRNEMRLFGHQLSPEERAANVRREIEAVVEREARKPSQFPPEREWENLFYIRLDPKVVKRVLEDAKLGELTGEERERLTCQVYELVRQRCNFVVPADGGKTDEAAGEAEEADAAEEVYDGEQKAIDRLYQFMRLRDIRPSQLEREVGLSNGYLSAQRKRRADIGEGMMLRILHYVRDINPAWLLAGEGEMLRSCTSLTDDGEEGVPFYDVDFLCGFDEMPNDQTVQPDGRLVGSVSNSDFFCRVTGHSMAPYLYAGDCIGLKECSYDEIVYGELYALVLEEFRTVKFVRRSSKPNCILLVPGNTHEFDTQEVHLSQVTRVFKVMEITRPQ